LRFATRFVTAHDVVYALYPKLGGATTTGGNIAEKRQPHEVVPYRVGLIKNLCAIATEEGGDHTLLTPCFSVKQMCVAPRLMMGAPR